MVYPLVLKAGEIVEEVPAEAGVYPKLRINSGNLIAGGAGNNLRIINGLISEYTSLVIWDQNLGTPSYWDDGLTEWT